MPNFQGGGGRRHIGGKMEKIGTKLLLGWGYTPSLSWRYCPPCLPHEMGAAARTLTGRIPFARTALPQFSLCLVTGLGRKGQGGRWGESRFRKSPFVSCQARPLPKEYLGIGIREKSH